jgi:glycosyltransferase involved in cell wall biosynthesis
VVIAALDVKDVIDIQLRALAEQDYSGAFEVVVADNGSTDGLREYLASHRLREQLALRCVDASAAPGIGHARNVGVRASQGDLLAFCDADDKVSGSWLSFLANAAKEFDAVAGSQDPTELSSREAVSWRPLGAVDQQPRSANATFPWGSGCNIAIWRTTFDDLGGWDESYVHALEDMDLCWRLQLAGSSLGWCPDAVVHYRLRDDLASLRRQAFNYGRGEARLYHEFRGRCMTGRPLWYLALLLVLIAIRNPLIPTTITRLPRGQWLWHVYSLFGRVRGSIELRVFYV